MSIFTDYWKIQMHGESFAKKESLTKTELIEIQNTIAALQKKGLPSSKIIIALQKQNKKLAKRWMAERAFWTEVKAQDTSKVGEIGEEIGFEHYKVILSPNACEICRKKTDNGRKIFTQKDIAKSGYGEFVPWHPNCYCVAIPYVV